MFGIPLFVVPESGLCKASSRNPSAMHMRGLFLLAACPFRESTLPIGPLLGCIPMGTNWQGQARA